ncbi:unnamed protein product [marine sediment metagenome]|uniref:Uncharacterized protein n=1 Tax=marine sediment metagenome TaxID=412755 RepID=X1E7N4_9ZZZZ
MGTTGYLKLKRNRWLEYVITDESSSMIYNKLSGYRWVDFSGFIRVNQKKGTDYGFKHEEQSIFLGHTHIQFPLENIKSYTCYKRFEWNHLKWLKEIYPSKKRFYENNGKGIEFMEECNKLIKENKIAFDPHEEKLIWIYNPKLFKQLMKKTVPSKIRKV